MENKYTNSVFDFSLRDGNNNIISLNPYRKKDLIVIINCLNFKETDWIASYYGGMKIKDNCQVLFIPCSQYFLNEKFKNEESCNLMDYLKHATHCHKNNLDELCFIIDNHNHDPKSEDIKYLGRGMSPSDLSKEIDKYVQ